MRAVEVPRLLRHDRIHQRHPEIPRHLASPRQQVQGEHLADMIPAVRLTASMNSSAANERGRELPLPDQKDEPDSPSESRRRL